MKVYVDELPKDCWNCPCFKNDINFPCGLSDGTQDYFLDEMDGGECPLLSLLDYTKQVRKEVCEEIGEQLGLRVNGKWQVVCDGCMTGDKTIMAVLDQIQGQSNDS